MRRLTRLLIQRCIANQAARLAYLVHDRITGIQTQAASDTTQLLSISYVHTCGANLHTLEAIDAIALRGIRLASFTQFSAGLPTLDVVCRQDGLRITHDSLNTGIRAKPDTGLLAHETGKNIGTNKKHGKYDPANLREIEVNQIVPISKSIHKPDREADTGEQGDQHPDRVLKYFLLDLVQTQWRIVQLAPGERIAFYLVLDPGEPVAPCGLKTKEAAPYA